MEGMMATETRINLVTANAIVRDGVYCMIVSAPGPVMSLNLSRTDRRQVREKCTEGRHRGTVYCGRPSFNAAHQLTLNPEKNRACLSHPHLPTQRGSYASHSPWSQSDTE